MMKKSLLAIVLTGMTLMGATITGSGSGGAIPDHNGVTPGTFTSDILISDTALITGDVTLTLTNLSHTWVGDLIVTLTHVDSATTQTIFSRVGLPPGPLSYGNDAGGTYRFGNFLGDFWLAASAASPTTIPSGDYAATGAGSSAPVDLANFFNGQSAAGTWRLSISDNFLDDTGSLGSWSLSLGVADPPTNIPPPPGGGDTMENPEPQMLLPVALALLAGWKIRRRS